MRFKLRGKCLRSIDGKFEIVNTGPRGGSQYALYEYDPRPSHQSYCLLRTMGTISHCINFPETKTEAQ
jgi:hypothetical protein